MTETSLNNNDTAFVGELVDQVSDRFPDATTFADFFRLGQDNVERVADQIDASHWPSIHAGVTAYLDDNPGLEAYVGKRFAATWAGLPLDDFTRKARTELAAFLAGAVLLLREP
jgi:hypothetical protein